MTDYLALAVIADLADRVEKLEEERGQPCKRCNSSGYIGKERCSTCHGRGYV